MSNEKTDKSFQTDNLDRTWQSVIAMLAAFLTGKIMNTKLEIILKAIPNSTNLGDKP